MTVVERTRLDRCRTRDCPWRDDEDAHKSWMAWCSRIPGHVHSDRRTHQHHPKKGMGGNNPESKIVSVICWTLHDLIDNGPFENAVSEINGELVYYIWDLHGGMLGRRVIGAVTGEGEAPTVNPDGVATALPSPVAASGASSDGGEDAEREAHGETVSVASPPSPGASAFTSRPEQDAGGGDSEATSSLGTPDLAVTPAPSVSLKEQA